MHYHSQTFLATCFLSLFSITLATPAPTPAQLSHECDVSNVVLPLPTGQNILTLPPLTQARPKNIAIGVGTQNYTCTDKGTYTSIGAVAELFDISCFFGTPQSAQCQAPPSSYGPTPPRRDFHLEFDRLHVLEHDILIFELLGPDPLILGHHFFVPNPKNSSAGISPDFDFSSDSQKGNPNAFIINSPIGSLPAPTGPDDVNWLQLGNLEGGLAKFTYRVQTTGAQPPAHCKPGSANITVPYSAQYWFFD